MITTGTGSRAIPAVTLLAAIAAAACGSSPQASSDAQDSASSAPLTAGEACMRLNEAEVQLAARCQGGSLADWRASWSSALNCADYDRHVAEGLAEYRPEGWDACLARYALPCGEANPYPCYYEILHGKVPDGQRCEDTEVCGTVSACLNLGGQTCGDVCARFGNEGEGCGLFCGASAPCVDGPYCTSGLFCLAGTCVKTKGLGEACGGPDQVTCGFGLFCDADPNDATSSGACARLAPGSTCRSDAGCPPNEFCQGSTCTPRRAKLASCADAPSSCVPWSICDSTGSQICEPAGGIGQLCFPFSLNGCVAGACDGQRCGPVAAPGASCAAATCVQGNFCDVASTTCQTCGP